jgi:hypothetical protein
MFDVERWMLHVFPKRNQTADSIFSAILCVLSASAVIREFPSLTRRYAAMILSKR